MTPLLKEAIDDLLAALVYVVSHAEECEALPYRLSVAIDRADEARSDVIEAMQHEPLKGGVPVTEWTLRETLREILEELQLADIRHDLQAKIVLALGSSGHPSTNPPEKA